MTDSEALAANPRHLGCAFLLAPVVAGLFGSVALAVTVTGDASPWAVNPNTFLLVAAFAVPIAFAHMLFLAVPLYLALSRRWRVGWGSAAAWGFLVGATPFGLLFGGAAIATAERAQDIRDMLWSAGYAGGCGAVGGLAFNAILALGERAKRKGGPLPDRPFGILPVATPSDVSGCAAPAARRGESWDCLRNPKPPAS